MGSARTWKISASRMILRKLRVRAGMVLEESFRVRAICEESYRLSWAGIDWRGWAGPRRILPGIGIR